MTKEKISLQIISHSKQKKENKNAKSNLITFVFQLNLFSRLRIKCFDILGFAFDETQRKREMNKRRADELLENNI